MHAIWFARSQLARGPVRSAHPDYVRAGWVTDHVPLSSGQVFAVSETKTGGKLHVQGDSRLYFVQDFEQRTWPEHKYMREKANKNLDWLADEAWEDV